MWVLLWLPPEDPPGRTKAGGLGPGKDMLFTSGFQKTSSLGVCSLCCELAGPSVVIGARVTSVSRSRSGAPRSSWPGLPLVEVPVLLRPGCHRWLRT